MAITAIATSCLGNNSAQTQHPTPAKLWPYPGVEVPHHRCQSGYRARTIAKTFERLSMSKHRLSRIYCCRKRVIAEFLERLSKKLWSNDDDHGDVAFWDQQKEEYLNENPCHEAIFAGEEEDDNDGDMVQESGNVGIEVIDD
eukprot:scaffold44550_cov54-Cyclotella_meneghiniana.AAC.16